MGPENQLIYRQAYWKKKSLDKWPVIQVYKALKASLNAIQNDWIAYSLGTNKIFGAWTPEKYKISHSKWLVIWKNKIFGDWTPENYKIWHSKWV